MLNEEYFINKIIQGGIYYLTLSDDNKRRPYVVISNDNGYGKGVITLKITSKFTSHENLLPIVIGHTVGFIRVSGAREINSKLILDADFAGIVSPDFLTLAITMYSKRFMNVDESVLDEKIKKYTDILDNLKLLIHGTNQIFDSRMYFSDKIVTDPNCLQHPTNEKVVPVKLVNVSRENNKSTILKNNTKIMNARRHSKIRNSSYPYNISDWNMDDLKQFRHDMFTMDEQKLSNKYQCSVARVNYLKSHVKQEISKRKNN